MNYIDLKNDIALWLADDDLVANIPTFIRLCEVKLNRTLKTLNQEKTLTLTVEPTETPSGTNYVPFPERFDSVVTITSPQTNPPANAYGDIPFDYVSPERMVNESQPYFYSIKGEIIMLPTGVEEIVLTYIEKFAALTDAEPENWLTDNAYDVLLYGSLSHAEGFVMNDQRIAVWDAAFMTGMQAINEEDERARTSGNTLRVI
jgi:hypothetical protein